MSDPVPPIPSLPAAGRFLVASPGLMDPNFTHSVVLLCRHGDEGSYGLIVNRRTDKRIADLESDAPLLEGRQDALYLGGPVAGDTLQVLHRLGTPGGLEVLGDVRLGGDPDILRQAIDGQESEAAVRDSVRFVIGCSGWGEGQLAAEIREGAWVVCPAEEDWVFDRNPETLWRRVLKSLGQPYADGHPPPRRAGTFWPGFLAFALLATAELRSGLYRAVADLAAGRPGWDAGLALLGVAFAAFGLVVGLRTRHLGPWGRATAAFHGLILLAVALAILLERFEARWATPP
jgi:putative transcriptional regulator